MLECSQCWCAGEGQWEGLGSGKGAETINVDSRKWKCPYKQIKNQGVVPVVERKKSKMEVESLDWLLLVEKKK